MNLVQGINRALRRCERKGHSWIALIDLWRRRSRDRQRLMMMSAQELKDLGITRYDAYYEARKPFWRA